MPLHALNEQMVTYHFDSDKEAVQRYLEEHVYPQSLSFDSLEEKWRYLVAHDYYDQEILKAYSAECITEAFTYAYQQKFSFLSLMGAMKFTSPMRLKP